jgi:hypothetical protein
MTKDCSTNLFGFTDVEGREVVADFDGGAITSDAGAVLHGAADRAIGLIDRFAACFYDERCQELVEHKVATLIGQRLFGIALGYEDLKTRAAGGADATGRSHDLPSACASTAARC